MKKTVDKCCRSALSDLRSASHFRGMNSPATTQLSRCDVNKCLRQKAKYNAPIPSRGIYIVFCMKLELTLEVKGTIQKAFKLLKGASRRLFMASEWCN